MDKIVRVNNDEWNFENWGIKYWSRTPEFEEYLRTHT